MHFEKTREHMAFRKSLIVKRARYHAQLLLLHDKQTRVFSVE